MFGIRCLSVVVLYGYVFSYISVLPILMRPNSFQNAELRRYFEIEYPKCEKKYLELDWNKGSKCTKIQNFHEYTGLLLWEFGPSTCEANAECWTGVLSCGILKQISVKNMYDFSSHDNFINWTMKSIHLYPRVAGNEIMAPIVYYTNIDVGNQTLLSEVLYFNYSITIPGEYKVEARLEEFYPGQLREWSMNEIEQGYDIESSNYLMTPTLDNCSKESIPKASLLINSPSPLKIVVLQGNEDDSAKSRLISPLPICPSANNSGRYIVIPSDISDLCESSAFISKSKIASNMKVPLRERFEKLLQIRKEYIIHVTKMKPKISKELSRIRSNYMYSNISNDSKWHYQETFKFVLFSDISIRYALTLNCRHINDNVCLLMDVSAIGSDTAGDVDPRLEIFAPYDCRYEIKSSSEVSFLFFVLYVCVFNYLRILITFKVTSSRQLNKCFSKNNSRPFNIIFHGDSLTRELFAETLFATNTEVVSSEKLKESMSSNQHHVSIYSLSCCVYSAILLFMGTKCRTQLYLIKQTK